MKSILTALVLLSSFAVSANCNLYIEKNGLTQKQDQILNKSLIEKGYVLTESKEDASYNLSISSGPRNRFGSMWFIFGDLKVNNKSEFIQGSDYAVMLPLHLLTFTISTFIPTKGSIAMYNFVSKVSTCENVQDNIASEPAVIKQETVVEAELDQE